MVRAPCRIRNIAAFNRDSFACEQPARRRVPAHVADPHRLSAGRAYTELPQALTLSVVRWCGVGLPRLTSARPTTPKDAIGRMPPDQSQPHHTPVKTRGLADPECLRLARPSLSRRETASAKRDRLSAAARAPSSQSASCPPSQGHGPPEPAIPQYRDRTGVRPVLRERCLAPISATD